MNKIFKIVFNAARGKMMVVNEATSSVQTGKKAAVTVAVVGALASGAAMASVSESVDLSTSESVVVSQKASEGHYSGIYADDSQKPVEITVANGKTLTVTTDGSQLASTGRLYGATTKTGTALSVKGDVTFDLDAQADNEQVRVFRVNGGSQSYNGKTVATATSVNGDLYGFSTWANSETKVNGSLLDVTLTSENADYVAGVYNFNGSTMDVEADAVKFTVTNNSETNASSQAVGIRGNASETNITADELDVVVKGGQLQTIGVFMSTDKGTRPITEINLTSDDMKIEVEGVNAAGVESSGADGYLNLLGDKATVKVTSQNGAADGFHAQYGGTISVENDVMLSVKAKEVAYGVSISESKDYKGGGAMTFDGKLTATVNSSDNDAVGVRNVISYEGSAGVVTFNDDVSMTVTSGGYDALGIWSAGIGSSVKTNGNLTISATSTYEKGDAYGAYANKGAQVTLGNDKNDVISITVDAVADGFGIAAMNKSSAVDVKAKTLTIDVTAADASGILVTNNTLDFAEGETQSYINIDADTITVNAQDGCGIVAMAKGIVTVEGDLTVNAQNALLARGDAEITINESGKHDVKLTGDIAFNYSASSSGTSVDADVNLNLVGSNSFLKGNIVVTGNPPEGKDKVTGMSLALSDAATWTSTADSFVNTLALNKNGIVAIGENTVTVKDLLTGDSGTVVLGADTSKFVVSGDDELDLLTVKKAGATADTMTADDAKALLENVTGVTNVQAVVDEGQVVGEIVVGADGTVEVAVNSKTEALADKVWLAPNMITRIMMNDVRKRMGDLRAAEGTHGAWARYNGGQMSASGVDADFHMVQVGIDTVPVADAPRFGVAFSYAQTEAKDNLGTTDMDSFSLAFYGTKMYDNGMFVDVIGRMATMDSDIVNAGAKGKMDNVALSLSGELGWRFDVTDRFFFEPSVEATYTYTNADTFTMTNGGTYELEAMDSLVGRAGFAAGFKCPANKGDVYVRAAVVHEFMGDATVNSRVGNNAAASLVSDGKDTWFEYAIGANFNVNKNTYVYADIERTEGATMDEDWRANVGVRFAF